MAPTKSNWLFSLLWINGAVAAVFGIQLAVNQNWLAGSLLHALAYSLLVANITGILGMLVLNGILNSLVLRKIPPIPVMVVGVLVISAACLLLAQTLFMEFRLIVPQNFWRDYLNTLRIAMPLAAVFGLGAMVHGSLRERIQSGEKKLQEKVLAEEKAQKLATEARLQSLESRIQPHFLFNTLNSISSLIAEDPVRAEETVGRLAVLLRASLDTSNQPLISLRQELTMVESYVDIQKVRFGDKLRGSVQVCAALQDAKVPPMSVQALVDNAVKHGITPQPGGGEFLVTAAADNGSLRIEVQDSGPGFDLTAVRAGHGLDNLVERLDALFGPAARLNAFRREGRSIVEMVLPLV
ncbi:MAG: histidine kinase [Acidobacteriota bacterium]|nr:histidine kinase [Acidobacteriota bacterium]